MQFKGISGPIRVWRLLGVSSGAGARAARCALSAAKAEARAIPRDTFRAALARQSGQVVYVRGEAGIGKTRLVEEMSKHAAAQGVVVHRYHWCSILALSEDSIRSGVSCAAVLGLPDGASETQRLDAPPMPPSAPAP